MWRDTWLIKRPHTAQALTSALIMGALTLAGSPLSQGYAQGAPSAQVPAAQVPSAQVSAAQVPAAQVPAAQAPSSETEEERRAAEEASRRVNRLSDQLKSPFCPGKTLLTCTSYQAFKLRKEMTQLIDEGKSDAEILAALRDSFGDDIENPLQPWYTVLVPIMPFVFGALIALWMFSMWLRGSKGREEEVGVEPEVDEEQRARLKALMRDDL